MRSTQRVRRDHPALFDDDDHDFEFRLTEDDTVERLLIAYSEECDRSRDVAAGMELDDLTRRPKQPRSLRWVLTHMIEETARHAGHLDLLRESIDGATGE